jgi:DNA topoisomerase I
MPRDLADDEPSAPLPPGLVYVCDREPGLARRRCGRGFRYLDADGRALDCHATLARIRGLGIPPAWREVWICTRADGHLQATGLDEAGRKQYRYHADWQAWRSEVKYGQLAAFGAALPRLRRRVARDLEREAGDLAFSLAAITTLIDRTHIRVGNRAYARGRSATYGATTLLTRHLSLEDGVVRLRYRAKGGKRVSHSLRDRRLHRILQEIDDLPGRNLFTYLTPEGEACPVASHHVNAYIAGATGIDGVSGKTFRTWAGTLAAFVAARAAEGRLTMRALCRAAADTLANTPAICRASYIHPRVLDLASLPPAERIERLAALPDRGPCGLRAEERRLLALLEA